MDMLDQQTEPANLTPAAAVKKAKTPSIKKPQKDEFEVPPKLWDAYQEYRGADKQLDDRRFEFAKELYQVRMTFTENGKRNDTAFGAWLYRHKFRLGDKERACLIQMGNPKYHDLAMKVFKKAHGKQVHNVWSTAVKKLPVDQQPHKRKSPAKAAGAKSDSNDTSKKYADLAAMTKAVEIVSDEVYKGVERGESGDEPSLAQQIAFAVCCDPAKHQAWVDLQHLGTQVRAYMDTFRHIAEGGEEQQGESLDDPLIAFGPDGEVKDGRGRIITHLENFVKGESQPTIQNVAIMQVRPLRLKYVGDDQDHFEPEGNDGEKPSMADLLSPALVAEDAPSLDDDEPECGTVQYI